MRTHLHSQFKILVVKKVKGVVSAVQGRGGNVSMVRHGLG